MNRFLVRAQDIQGSFERKSALFLKRIGVDFLFLLFGFALLVLGLLGIFTYLITMGDGFDYLLNGNDKSIIPLYLNPLLHFVVGGFFMLIVLFSVYWKRHVKGDGK